MDTCRVFMFILLLLFPVLGQIADNKLDDVIFLGDYSRSAICHMNININDSCVDIELPKYVGPTEIDYDWADDTLYWIEHYRIFSAALSGNSKNTLIELNYYRQIYGIAVDSISRLLFYTSSYTVSRDSIFRPPFDPSFFTAAGDGFIAVVGLKDFLHKSIISGVANPQGISLDIQHGTIYWADAGSPAKIEKSNYDGTNRIEIVNSGLTYPYGIDVDVNDGVLYWCDVFNFTIERVNVDGSNRSIIYQWPNQYSRGCSISLYQSYLYLAWRDRFELMRIGTDGKGLVLFASAERISTGAIHVNTKEILGINGCSYMNGGCSNFCFPLPGGNKICACPNLMTLQPDGQTCRKDTLPEVLLVSYSYYGFLSGEDIRKNYTHFVIPLPHQSQTYDIDYDRTTDHLYWVQENQIYSSKLFGKNQTISHYNNSNVRIYGIATDTISRLLFYTDRENEIIALISLHDFSQKTIISTGLVDPADIVADPINGIIYWADTGSPAKIEKSNYDGTNRQEIVGTDLKSPNDVDVDLEAGLLYWCDFSNFKIERCSVDGSKRSIIYQEQVSYYGCSIALYQSFIFFTTSWPRYDIRRVGIDGSGLITIAPFVHEYPWAIHVTINRRLGNNECSNGNDGCSHFCFPMPDGNHVCGCPNLMSLQPDRKTCQLDNMPEQFLLIADVSKAYIYRMDITNYSYIKIPVQTGSNAIDYEPNTALMFWTDTQSRQISSGSIYGNNHTTSLLFKRNGGLNGIAVDVISRLLFYTDSSYNIVGVICLNRGLHKTVITYDLYAPNAIVIDSVNSYIYWSSFNKIEKSNYDGTSRQKLVDTGLEHFVDLALDINEGVIYWCHYNTRKIEVANVDGFNRQVLYSDQTLLYVHKCSIALHESHLYYIDMAQGVLMRIRTDGTGMTSFGSTISYRMSDLYVLHNVSRKPGINGCSKDNGGCSHLCLPRAGGSKVCDCPDNMTLQQDGLTCETFVLPKHFILLVNPGDYFREMYIVDIPSYRYITFGYDMYSPSSVAYDPVNQEFYWTDLRFRRIMLSSANGNIKRTVKQLSRSAHPVGIALDVRTRVLFYVDNNNGIIAALSLDGSMHKTIINSAFSDPSYIAIDPINGFIYWISRKMPYKIEKSNYDGTQKQEVISAGLYDPYSLAIDFNDGFIYWSNSSAIERCNMDGRNRQLIYQDRTAYFTAIALYQSNIYIRGFVQNRHTFMKIGRDGSNPVLFGSSLYSYNAFIAVHSNESMSVDMDVCGDKPCNNCDTCTNSNGSFYSNCTRGWQGGNCSTDIDECRQDRCQNGGVCTNTYGSYICTCSPGWQGHNCTDAQNTLDKAHGEIFIILITVGSVLVLVVGVFLLCCLKRRSNRCKKKEDVVYDDVQIREMNQAEHEYNQIVVNSNIYYNTVNI